MNDIYIYSAGSLTYLKKIGKLQKAFEWREKLEDWAKDNDAKIFNPATTFKKEVNLGYSEKIIVQQNEFFLQKSTIMVVQLDYLDYSPGTIYEMVLFKSMNKPIIAFGENKHWSPHMNYCISQHCNTIEDTIELLNNMFL